MRGNMWECLYQKLFVSHNYWKSVQPLFVCALLCGLTPLRVTSDASGHRSLRPFLLGYLGPVVHAVAYCVCALYTIDHQESWIGYFMRTNISIYGNVMYMLFSFCSGAIILVTGIFRAGKMQRFIADIDTIDRHFERVGVRFNYTHLLRVVLTAILLALLLDLTTLLVSVYCLNALDVHASPHLWYVGIVEVVGTSVLLVQFQLTCVSLQRKTKMMNMFYSQPPAMKKQVRSALHSMRRPADIYDCFRGLFIFCILCGIMPFYPVAVPQPHLKPLLLGFVNIFARMAIFGATYGYSFWTNESLLQEFFNTNVTRHTDALQKFNGMLGILTVLVISLLRRNTVVEIVEQFDSLDRHFNDGVGVVIDQQDAAKKINRAIAANMGTNAAFICLSFFVIVRRHGMQVGSVASIAYYSPHIIVLSIVLVIFAFVYKITVYLQALNEVLKNLSHQFDSVTTIKNIVAKQRSLKCLDAFSMHTVVSKNPSEIIEESMEIHQLICNAAATANKYFTYQLLTIISIAFLIIVFDAYYVLETILGKSKRESKFKTVEFVTFFSCQMILYLIAIISIVEGSNRAIKKSEKTSGIVHALLRKANNVEVKEKLQQFSMQLMHLKIKFTAAGLFNIDRTLYFTISGALTTYLIILLQFTSNPHSTLQTCACEPAASTALVANVSDFAP